jgi:UDP-N-acetylmuramate: L-alanyl-gamma-D-glutamyl-meso-diaminopimelate ligase
VNGGDGNLRDVLDRGCWSSVEFFNAPPPDDRGTGKPSVWTGRPLTEDYSAFEVEYGGETAGDVVWPLIGRHNMSNALAAIAAAARAGVPPGDACAYLASFRSVKRRLEVIGERDGVRVYDDFAHHPTEIKETLTALRRHVGRDRIIAILEPRSNTMRMGRHRRALPESLTNADLALVFQPPGVSWDVASLARDGVEVFASVAAIIDRVTQEIARGGHVVIMSNGNFEGLAESLVERCNMKPAPLH